VREISLAIGFDSDTEELRTSNAVSRGMGVAQIATAATKMLIDSVFVYLSHLSKRTPSAKSAFALLA
jgi:hypothetical protein